MKVEVDDLLTIDGEKYITMATTVYNNKNYAFVNKIVDDEPTKEFYTFEVEDDSVIVEKDEKILNVLLPIFSNEVQKMVDKVRQLQD